MTNLLSTLTRPRNITSVDLVVTTTGSGLVGVLTAYTEAGQRHAMELYPCDLMREVFETARLAASTVWRVNLGDPLWRHAINGRELFVYRPIAL